MGDFRNDVCFSPSREKLLAVCPRRFFYAVYLMWGGWYNGDRYDDPRCKRAYELKNVNTEAEWAGKIVHDRAQWALDQARKRTDFVNEWGGLDKVRKTAQQQATRVIDEGLRQARTGLRGSPKRWVQLSSIVNGGAAEEEWIKDRVKRRIDGLFGPDELWTDGEGKHVNVMARALAKPKKIVHVEELIEWRVGAVKCFLKHDLVMRGVDPTNAVIIDWKTGIDKSVDEEQLDFYASWAISNGWKSATTGIAHLEHGRTVSMRWVEADPTNSNRRTAARVADFIDALKARLVDGNTERNEPIEARFESTSDPANCYVCPFAVMCEREGTKPSIGHG